MSVESTRELLRSRSGYGESSGVIQSVKITTCSSRKYMHGSARDAAAFLMEIANKRCSRSQRRMRAGLLRPIFQYKNGESSRLPKNLFLSQGRILEENEYHEGYVVTIRTTSEHLSQMVIGLP